MNRRIVSADGLGTGPRGRTFLYVLPCAYEDFAKLGITADPIARMSAFSHRYYEFFDLDSGWLVEAESTREARGWETRWKRALRNHAAPAPLLVPGQAGGHTEWLRGALPALALARDELAGQGFQVHAPLTEWVRARLLAWSENLDALEQAIVARFGPVEAWPSASMHPSLAALRDVLDGYRTLALPLDAVISAALGQWLSRNSLSSCQRGMAEADR